MPDIGLFGRISGILPDIRRWIDILPDTGYSALEISRISGIRPNPTSNLIDLILDRSWSVWNSWKYSLYILVCQQNGKQTINV